MRLLLDEHLAPLVAERLRERGHDVAAVTERLDLRGAGDDVLLDLAAAERRAVVTYDKRFRALARQRLERDQHHYGLVLLSRRAIPDGERHVGRLIAALEAVLGALPADDALVDREWWPA